MGRIKCFFVEEVERKKIKCDYQGCDDPDCFREIVTSKRTDTGELVEDAWELTGAMFYVNPSAYSWRGSDGKCLVVVTPAGPWFVDSRASNCTRKDDNEHRCWVREGVPPNVTAGKGGNTCAAGAGSIMMNNGKIHYHGFLRGGYLEEC